jgi:hypothetical protein
MANMETMMDREVVFGYLVEKLKSGSYLSDLVCKGIGITSLLGWHEYFYSSKSSIHTEGVGRQLTEILAKELIGLKDWIIIFENSSARCSDPWLSGKQPPVGNYFCHSEGIYEDRVYFYISPKEIQDLNRASEITSYALNAWQNVGFIIERDNDRLRVKKIFGDNNDLSSVLIIDIQADSIDDNDFTRLVKGCMLLNR